MKRRSEQKADGFEKRWKREIGNCDTNPNADLWAQMEAIEKRCLIQQPEGSFTALEYATKRKINRSTAHEVLDRMASLGEVEKLHVPGARIVFWRIAKK